MILARLRIGHTRLTHSYLLLNFAPPSYPHCSEENLSVEHFFICPALQPIKSTLRIPATIKSALRNTSSTYVTPSITNSYNYTGRAPQPNRELTKEIGINMYILSL